MQASTTIQDVAAIATAIGVLFAAFGLRQARYQRQRIFEDSFVQRYWQIMDCLSCAALAAEVTSPLSDSDEHAARSYIRLCEDELELRVYGSIGRKTSDFWCEGIRQQMQRWPFDEVWRQILDEERERVEPLFILTKSLVVENQRPAPRSPWRARMRDLN